MRVGIFRKKNSLTKTFFAAAVFAIIILQFALINASDFIDTTQANFDAGTTNRTTVGSDGNTGLALETATVYYPDGNFTSRILTQEATHRPQPSSGVKAASMGTASQTTTKWCQTQTWRTT